jgi:diguanylate cyclase (GGDEF)-like protein/putative nucleotidyltransferase with HDIG domain
MIWLGIAGGIVLGTAASLTRLVSERKYRKEDLFQVLVDVVSYAMSGSLLFLATGYVPGAANRMAGNDLGSVMGTIAAISSMALAQYLCSSTLVYVYKRISGAASIKELIADEFMYHAAAGLLTLAGTLLLYFVFAQFGIEFGLVILTIAVAADLAYRFHLKGLAQKTKEISNASRIHLATVEALATAIDARDQVGMGHVRRTQIFAIGIGEMLGLSESEISALRTGALLHDIGKLAVPDHILNKLGRLTPAELEKTKIHASVGASILEKVGFEDPVVPTVKYHHEAWDGSGYPEGLRGHNIPLTARILCVADAYDTLRGARPYRAAISREEACSYLMNGAGQRFDPLVVNVFLNNLKELETAVEQQGLSYEFDGFNRQPVRFPEIHTDQNYVEQIKRANREVFTLYELARDFSSSVNLHETLSLFTKKIAEFVTFDTCSVYLLDAAKESAAAEHIDGQSGPAFKGRHIRIGEGPTGDVLKTGKAVKNAEPASDFLTSHSEAVSKYRSMTSVALIAEEEVIGAVSLYSFDASGYGEEHMRLLETISHIASDAISKSLRHLEAETYALTDPMTGLPNARSLQMQFEKEAARSSRVGTSFQVLMLDLDGFKAVNDTFGHKIGDKMLKEVGRIIRGQLRDYDFLARYAGDEFVAIIPDAKPEHVNDLCGRICEAVTSFALPVGDEIARVGISIGASGFSRAGETFDEVVIAADKAMYTDKSERKKRTCQAAAVESVIETAVPVLSLSELDGTIIPAEGCIVELDETHIISAAVN